MAGMFSKLPFRQHDEAKPADSEEEGESLTTILTTAEDRIALTLLIGDCTKAMRQSIVDIFDPKQTGKDSDIMADIQGDEALLNPDVDPGKVDVAEQDKQKKELEQREKELSAQRFQEQKEAALKHHDDWGSSVIQRVGEVLNARDGTDQQKQAEEAGARRAKASSDHTTHPKKSQEPPDYHEGVDKALNERYPPLEHSLKGLSKDKKILILHSVLLLLLSLEHYHAQSRVLLLHLTTSLGLSLKYLGHDESKIARGLLTAAENLSAEDETKKKADENKTARKWKVGLATAAGAALIGVTGGLAAPLLAAGVGSVMGGLGLGATAAAGYLGTLAGSSVLIGGLFGAYGGRMSGKMMDQYAREVEDFAFVPVRSVHKPQKGEDEYRRLRVGIGISGWLYNQNDVVGPWRVVGMELETFALRWELEALMGLGNSLTTMVKSAAWGYAKKEIISHTVFAALSAGLWPLGLLKVSRIIDNPWSVASYRAQKAGEVLADALINKAQGERPVTLIGYSLGAKVIYTCLRNLAERKAFGLVESVVVMGAPTPSDSADWRMVRSVVSGRVVNAYSTQDYILAFLYRSSGFQYGVAGLQPIENVKGIENVDVSDMVSGHTTYRFLAGTILKKVGFEDVDIEELENEQKARREEEEKQERERNEGEKKEEATSSGGTSASVAYEKARSQWFQRKQGQDGQAVSTDAITSANKTADADAAYQAMKAKSEARRAAQQTPAEP
ncbi:hypothetical protein LTR37_008257 [Vermiconidia calcicola]|uniref:Uncharacterized protein n=1 Tax=Vermiconidia calcicola TaxID=1690605 RepID=A0ACC3NE02_9PEZI|nr:hypothetical protein LTR37_008257 [Vermiconidia calcicola]